MWAHIGDHVSEYLVYVDNIEIRSVIKTNKLCISHGYFALFFCEDF